MARKAVKKPATKKAAPKKERAASETLEGGRPVWTRASIDAEADAEPEPDAKPVIDPVDGSTRFIELSSRKKALKAALARVTAELGAIEEQLVESFINRGVTQMRVGKATVYVREERWPQLIVPDGRTKVEVRLELVHALEAAGHEAVISYNAQSLRSVVNDLLELDDDDLTIDPEDIVLPDPFGKFLKMDVRNRIGARGVPALEASYDELVNTGDEAGESEE